MSERDGPTRDLAANGFIKLLKQLRKTFLQDSVQWRAQHPNSFLFQHPLFHGADFKAFEAAALATTELQVHQFDPSLREMAPSLEENLTSNFSLLRQALVPIAENVEISRREGHGRDAHIHSLRMQMATVIHAFSLPQPGPLSALRSNGTLHDVMMGLPASATVSLPGSTTSDSSVPTDSTTPTTLLPPAGFATVPTLSEPSVSLSLAPVPNPAPYDPAGVSLPNRIIMNRSIKTVTDCWQEYQYGYNGMAAISVYYATWNGWKKDDKERKWFDRRKPVWETIKLLQAGPPVIPEEQAVARVESWRKSQKLELNGLSARLLKMTKREKGLI